MGETNKFRLGDRVKLNIGGPEMCVQRCEEKIYICRWFVNGVAKLSDFAEECLELVVPSSPRIIYGGGLRVAGTAPTKVAGYEQHKNAVRVALQDFGSTTPPPTDGWIRTVRMTLRMTGKQLAGKLGVTKGRVYKVEQDELAGGVTLKTMRATAEAMDCRFVYAVVPNRDIDLILSEFEHGKDQ